MPLASATASASTTECCPSNMYDPVSARNLYLYIRDEGSAVNESASARVSGRRLRSQGSATIVSTSSSATEDAEAAAETTAAAGVLHLPSEKERELEQEHHGTPQAVVDLYLYYSAANQDNVLCTNISSNASGFNTTTRYR